MSAIDIGLYFNMGKWGFLAVIVLFVFLYLNMNWDEIKALRRANCLLWKHPDNTDDAAPVLDLGKIENPTGPSWLYKSLFFIPAKQLKWCYEKRTMEEESGKVTYPIVPYIPEEHINFEGITTGELADALDWRPAKRVLERKAPLLEKLAYGGVLLMGGAALFGVMALLDMLGKGG